MAHPTILSTHRAKNRLTKEVRMEGWQPGRPGFQRKEPHSGLLLEELWLQFKPGLPDTPRCH
jgi:hypothetical protein